MATQDPFRDKRKRGPKGGMPKQAQIQRERKRARDGKRTMAATKRLKETKKELVKTEKELTVKQQMLALVSQAPTPAQQRKLIWATFEELGFNPVTELIDCVNQIDDPKDRANVIEKLSSMVISKPKSVDIEAEIKGGLTISVVDFSQVSQAQLKQKAAEAAADTESMKYADPEDPVIDVSEYDEFESDEDRHASPSYSDPNPAE